MQRTQEKRACQTQVCDPRVRPFIYTVPNKTTLAQPGGSGNLLLTLGNKEILLKASRQNL